MKATARGTWLPIIVVAAIEVCYPAATAPERPAQAGVTVNKSAAAQSKDPRVNHWPLDNFWGDYHSYETKLDAYNYKINRQDTTLSVIAGGTNDADEGRAVSDIVAFLGKRSGASGEFSPRRVADGDEVVAVQGTVGLLSKDGAPLLNGIVLDETFATVEIINADDRGDRVFAGFTPTKNGVKAYGGLRKDNQDQFFPKTPTFPGATGIDVDVQKGRRVRNGRLQDFTQVRVRKTGARDWTTLFRSAEPVPAPAGPPTRLEVAFLAGGLNSGGRVYFDDIVIMRMNGSAEQPPINSLMRSARHDVQVFAELSKPNFDSLEAVDHLSDGIDLIQTARQEMRACDCQPSTRIPQALGATLRALTFDRQAITAIEDGRINDAIEGALKALHQKAKAGLFMRGHNLKDKNKRFDDGDPQLFDLEEFPPGIFAEGFEAGDVNAWSR